MASLVTLDEREAVMADLGRYKALRGRERGYLANAESCRRRAESTGGQRFGEVRGGQGFGMADMVQMALYYEGLAKDALKAQAEELERLKALLAPVECDCSAHLVMVMVYVEGMTMAEAATECGYCVKQVWRLHRKGVDLIAMARRRASHEVRP